MAQGVTSLSYAVRPRVVARFFGHLCLSLVVMAAVPAVVALLTGDFRLAARLGVVTLALAGLSLTARVGAPADLRVNEGLVVTALVFLTASLAMAWPLERGDLAPIDALFEAISGITTTGLTTRPEVGGQSYGFLFARAWLQWYGGLVIVVLAAAVILEAGVAARRLAGPEQGDTDLVGGTRVRARKALQVYAVLTVACTAIVTMLGVPPWDALLHTLAAVSTGGFSSHPDSLAGLAGGLPARAALMIFAFAGAVSLLVHLRGWRRPASLFGDPGVTALVAAVLITVALLWATQYGLAWGGLADAALLGVSAQTGTGFSPVDVAPLHPAAKVVLIVSMLIGGDAGSTAGGIKVVRFLIIVRLVQTTLLRTCLPSHAVLDPEMGGRRLDADDLRGVATVVSCFVAVVVISWLPFLMADLAPLDSLFEVVSATATTGLTTGITDQALPDGLKAVLMADMLMGRLEVVALLVLFYPRTWLGRRGGD